MSSPVKRPIDSDAEAAPPKKQAAEPCTDDECHCIMMQSYREDRFLEWAVRYDLGGLKRACMIAFLRSWSPIGSYQFTGLYYRVLQDFARTFEEDKYVQLRAVYEEVYTLKCRFCPAVVGILNNDEEEFTPETDTLPTLVCTDCIVKLKF